MNVALKRKIYGIYFINENFFVGTCCLTSEELLSSDENFIVLYHHSFPRGYTGATCKRCQQVLLLSIVN